MKAILFPVVLCLACMLFPAMMYAQQGKEIVSRSMEGHIFRPRQLAATEERLQTLRLPSGFVIEKFAEGLGKPRMLAVSGDGSVYVTDRENGTLTLLQDRDEDGKAEVKEVLAEKQQLHGIAISGDTMYLATVTDLYQTTIQPDGSIDRLRLMIDGLPDGGQHGNRTLKVGPDGALYISVGSTCNSCDETNEENATLLKMNRNSKTRIIFASGLRNTLGFDWHPQTGELWGFDHGIDWLGDQEQQEELNKLEEGKDYGWPFVYGDGKFEVHHDPKGMTHEEYAAKSEKPVLLYQAHAAPIGLLFYTGSQFPEAFKNDAFVTMHGSWNKKEPSGYKIIRVKYENGKPVEFEDFVSGFLTADKRGQFGRVCGLAQSADGSLLVTDDTQGIVYRVSYGK